MLSTAPVRRTFSNRRNFLKGIGGLMIALPYLESVAGGTPHPSTLKRMVILNQSFGVYAPDFYPETVGKNYQLPEGMKELASIQQDFTCFKNVDMRYWAGHRAASWVLRDLRPEDTKHHKDGGVSVDVRAAEHFAVTTRFPMLSLGNHPEKVSWSRTGTPLPKIQRPIDLFNAVFVNDSAAEKSRKKTILAENDSILDAINANARTLKRKISNDDKQRLDEYFTSVRMIEKKLKERTKWVDIPKPRGDAALAARLRTIPPGNADPVKTYEAFLEMIPLVLKTDSTRVITLSAHTSGGIRWSLPGVNESYHTLTHHGKLPERIEQLKLIDQFHMQQFAKLINNLKTAKLLDSTQVLWCSGLSDGARHSNKNLPLLLAGGGYLHGQCIDVQSKRPLANLYNSMLQRLGVETEHFSLSTETMEGLT